MLTSRQAGAVLLFLLLCAAARPASAFNEPPVNTGLTSFLDGGGPPGFYLIEYLRLTDGSSARNKDGNPIPGGARVVVTSWLNQLTYVSTATLGGGHPGIEVLVPVVTPSVTGSLGPVPLTANTGGLADLVVGPMIQWSESTFLGRPFPHRFELTAIFPTGKYSSQFAVNPGANIFTLEPYYAFTWFFAPAWETSGRIIYTWNGNNGATQVKPGQMVHGNFALSRQVLPSLRVGPMGYFLKQLNDDQVAGTAMPGTRERAFGLGPGLAYTAPGLIATLSEQFEFGVQNRFRGQLTTLQIIWRF